MHLRKEPMRITRSHCIFGFLLLSAGLASMALLQRGIAHANYVIGTRHPVAGHGYANPAGSANVSPPGDGRELYRVAAATNPPVSKEHGAEVYRESCSVCHGADRSGVPPNFPSLIGISKRLPDAEIAKQIKNGKGRMLAFPDMSDVDLNSLLLFLKTPKPEEASKPSTTRL